MALTQMALDSLDFDATVALATTVAPHVDILEIGTPCIKHNGIKLLEVLRAKFPNNKILVDLKTMDAGYYEAEPFYKAGADICTVLGTADLGTIKGVIDVANKYGKEAQVDLINVEDKATRTKEAVKMGAHIIGVHTGLDQQAAGQTPFADLALVNGLGLGVKVSVAGGVKAATVRQVVDAGATIVVAGAAIYGAADPAASAAEITGLARGTTSGGGLFGWLKGLFS
ncbi:MAG TPA: 3-hexulose-6-phosphate synthase [Methylophilaceae bacterium]|nr:3-hexulose-6-phosphate synthase [Methylophilaceae bacterium]